ncbi:hypothetical protein N7478_002592 [Penicillium angulare]|uniref:uncharacterized protein n=1 Tax=Penicillium angulare TaxID=116970 RepID=UPI002541D89B|nr:uncharacterized protein N7478_002592 [Penicillium angulare]KAJ5286906.1 hypothetical protein N7478_002592 [Penicillium angulare]
MRCVSKLLAIAAVGALQTNAMEASIFKFTPGSLTDSGSTAVSEDFARLALKLRMESSLASALGTTETNLDHLDQFADPNQISLFGSNHQAPEKSLIIIEGFNEAMGLTMRQRYTSNLFIPKATYNLIDEPFASLEYNNGGEKHCLYDGGASRANPAGIHSARECLTRDPILSASQNLFDSDVLDVIHSAETRATKDQKTIISRLSFKAESGDGILDLKPLESIFEGVTSLLSTDGRQATIVLLTTSKNDSKMPRQVLQRDTQAYGESAPIGVQHERRSVQDVPLHSNLAPVCQASNSSCAEATENCSGHGYCYLKYGSGTEGSTGNCYACRCQQTTVKKSDGTVQKIQWGGPACQKQDISSPFFLIAGVSVFAILAVSSAIGMLFSMGQQELPSVIGAGVGGSKLQT